MTTYVFFGSLKVVYRNHPYAAFVHRIKTYTYFNIQVRTSRYAIYLAGKKVRLAIKKLNRDSLLRELGGELKTVEPIQGQVYKHFIP